MTRSGPMLAARRPLLRPRTAGGGLRRTTIRTTARVASALALLGAGLAPAHASVVLNGTRIIYQAGQHGKTLQLSNQDAHPNLVQIWVEREPSEHTGPDSRDTRDVPFVLNPPIFRMEPHAGQMVRLRFGGEALPQDRESVFYLNFTQVPALKEDEREANRLVLLFKSQVKLFYRPQGLKGQEPSCASLRISQQGEQMQVENTTPYHVTVIDAAARAGVHQLPLAGGHMLAPFARTHWPLEPQAASLLRDAATLASPVPVLLTLRNDYGSDSQHRCTLT